MGYDIPDVSNGASIKVMERSLFSARHCFVESMLSEGSLQPGMFHVLQEWFDFIDVFHQPRVDLIVYLRTSPAVAYERLLSRGRPEEASVPLQLLARLHELHEEWIAIERDVKGTPVVIIDADQSLADLEPQFAMCIDNMYRAIESLPVDE